MVLGNYKKRRKYFMRRMSFILLWAALIPPLIAQQPPAVPLAGLPNGVYRYGVNFRIGENPIDLKMVIAIWETEGQWTVAETTAAPSGEISDTGTYDKKSLMLITRAVKQGPKSINLTIKDNRVIGKMIMAGSEQPFDVGVDGSLFGDGPAFVFAIGTLPLAEAYSNSFRSFDVETQKPKLTNLRVAGLEKITVPAGLFESYRVEISFANGGAGDYTVWIAKNSRKPVKIVTALPQMGGSKLTAELQ
jgi:hypothetical protein